MVACRSVLALRGVAPLPAFQTVDGEHVGEVGVVAVDLGFGFEQDGIGAESVVLTSEPVGHAMTPAVF